jgi:hypothetical protein
MEPLTVVPRLQQYTALSSHFVAHWQAYIGLISPFCSERFTCVCVCVCMYVCIMHVRMYVCSHTHTHTHTHTMLSESRCALIKVLEVMSTNHSE